MKDDGAILTLSVKEASAFYYVDADSKGHYFHVMSIFLENVSTLREYFMEVVYDNPKIAILMKPTLSLRDKGAYYQYGYSQYGGTPSYNPSKVNVYYLLHVPTGELQALNEKQAMTFMENKIDAVKAFMKSNRIKLKEVDDYVRVIEYYASL